MKSTKTVSASRLTRLLAVAFLGSWLGIVHAASITLNLKDADIEALISTVSEATGKNFIIDPRVKGKVTIISNQPMEGEALYQVFLSILSVHGFAAVPSGEVIKIVPEVNAKQASIPNATRKKPGEGDEMVTRVLAIENVNAAQLVPILRPLVPQQGHLAAYANGNVLIITDRAANVERLEKIIRRIDISSDGEIEVIPLEHAAAAEVVRIITALDKGKGAKGSPDQGFKVVADERSNSVLLMAGRAKRLRLRAIIGHLDTPVPSEGDTKVIFLRYANAKDLVPVLTGVSQNIGKGDKGKNKTRSRKVVSIQAHESTNALVITAPPDVQRALAGVVKKLDVRRAQVLVEAIIAEVSTNTTAELGIQWAFDGTPDNPTGLTNFNTSGGNSIALLATNPLTVGEGLTVGVGDFTSSSLNFAALLRALAGDSSTNILSTPNLVTMDNEEAEIVVGQNVPFLTGSYASTGSTSTPTNPFQTIQRQDVGLTLKVKPQINEGDAIKLDIEQEVSSISSGTSGASDLITNKRSIRTSVMIEDRQVVVLGGLIEDQQRESVQKVPGLGDLPLLGQLFSYTSTTNEKKNLMVFLHPVILRDAAMQGRLSGGKYLFMRDKQLQSRAAPKTLLRDSDTPLLPTLDELRQIIGDE